MADNVLALILSEWADVRVLSQPDMLTIEGASLKGLHDMSHWSADIEHKW